MITYPFRPGAQDRDTSEKAAVAIGKTAPILRIRALVEITHSRGLTADEVADRMGKSILSIRPRVTELARMNLVEDSGIRRKNLSGRHAIVWCAVTSDPEALAA